VQPDPATTFGPSLLLFRARIWRSAIGFAVSALPQKRTSVPYSIVRSVQSVRSYQDAVKRYHGLSRVMTGGCFRSALFPHVEHVFSVSNCPIWSVVDPRRMWVKMWGAKKAKTI